MMTPGAGRPPSDVTAVPALCTKAKSSPKDCFLSLDRYILTSFANLNIKNTRHLNFQGGASAPLQAPLAKFKDSSTEDRPSQSPGQECSRPRPRTKDTNVSVLQEQKQKNVFKNFFQAISKKKVFKQLFQVISKKKKKKKKKNGLERNFSANLKILTIQKIVLSSSRGQGNFRGLEASRPRPRTWSSRRRPRASKCVLEDSTSVWPTHFYGRREGKNASPSNS